jgi:hypothetical protein
MKNIRLFETSAEYESTNLDYPNVALTQDDGKTHCATLKPIEFVDLGLSVKWMKYNVGAKTETDYGLYFQWGDTVGYTGDGAKTNSYWSTCPGNGGRPSKDETSLSAWNTEHLTNGILNADVDAAYVHTNGAAKTPTTSQIIELVNNTTSEWTTKDGINGCKFINSSDSSKYIFIPCGGNFWESSLDGEKQQAYVWSSSVYNSAIYKAYNLLLTNAKIYGSDYGERCAARNVRGVQIS